MNVNRFWQRLLLTTALVPSLAAAQTYNHVFVLQTPYQNSVHTDAVQISSGDVAEGGTIDNPYNSGQNVVQVGVVDPSGFMYSPSYFYYDPNGANLNAVDMVESLNPDWVVQVANYDEPGSTNQVVVYEMDPYNAGINWSVRLGAHLGEDLFGAAIVSNKHDFYYVLGYMRDGGGNMTPYLAQIDYSGNVNWEMLYYDNQNNFSHESIDLVYDEALNEIIFTSNVFDNFFNPKGFSVCEVDAGAGGYINASHVPKLSGTEDVEVRDITITPGGEYALVGRIHNTPEEGFLVQYKSGLNPYGPFSTIYQKFATGIFMTGIMPYAGGGYLVSYEWGVNYPNDWSAVVAIDMSGVPDLSQSFMYFVRNTDFTASSGIIPLNSNQDFAVKGSLDFFGTEELHIFADFVPIANNGGPPSCNEPIDFDYYYDDPPDHYEFKEDQISTNEPTPIEVKDVTGEIYDCDLNYQGNFRLAAPTGIADNMPAEDIKTYPNPTTGQLTIELTKELVDLYNTAELYNVLGEKVLTFRIGNTIENIDLSAQTPGIYLLRMKGDNGHQSAATRITIK